MAEKDLFWFSYLYLARPLCRIPIPSLWRSFFDRLEGLSIPLLRSYRRATQDAIADLCPTLDDPGAVARENARRHFRRTMEDLILDRLVERREVRHHVTGLPRLEEGLAKGKGVILVSGHFFANRMAKRLLAAQGFPIMSIRNRLPPDREMGRVGQKYFQPRYVAFLEEVIQDEVFVQDPACSLKILRRLREGGIVNLHIDAAFSAECIRLEFLGHERPFPTGFIHFARRTGAAVLAFQAYGSSRDLEIEFPRAYDVEGREPGEALRPMVRDLEERILRAPSQWELWTRSRLAGRGKRWKKD